MIVCSKLYKYYGSAPAIKDLSFELDKGQILIILGPNGAGKSTLIKMLSGYIFPSCGEISICGMNYQSNRFQISQSLGYLPETTPLYTDTTVSEFLLFSAKAHGIAAKNQQSSISKVLSRCTLETVKHKLVSSLSKGYKQRVCFAQSIIHDPKILIMDEPTDGLDPIQKNEMQQLIKSLSSDTCIILSTHILSEAETIADRIMLLNKGTLNIDESLKNIKENGHNLKNLFEDTYSFNNN